MKSGWKWADEPIVLELQEYQPCLKSNSAPALCKHSGTSSACG